MGTKHPTYAEALKQTDRTEAQVYTEAANALEARGFYQPEKAIKLELLGVKVVGYYASTQQRRKSAQTIGMPDMYVTLAGSNRWLGVELKARRVGAKGQFLVEKMSDEQKMLAASGCIIVVQGAWQVPELIEMLKSLQDR